MERASPAPSVAVAAQPKTPEGLANVNLHVPDRELPDVRTIGAVTGPDDSEYRRLTETTP